MTVELTLLEFVFFGTFAAIGVIAFLGICADFVRPR